MWAIDQEKHVQKCLDRAPRRIQERFEIWKDIVVSQGPVGLLQIRGFYDHALSGQWKGARSSYLNDQWRVIYVIQARAIKVIVLEVTPHDYRKKS